MALENEDDQPYTWETDLLMGRTLENAPYHILLNEELCIMAVNYDPHNLKYIPEEARTDMVVFTAIERDPDVAKYLEFKNHFSRIYNLETIIPLLSGELKIEKEYPITKETICAPKSLRDNIILAKELIQRDPLTIAGLDSNVRSDKEIALLALNKNWKTVIYLDSSLHDNYEVMLTTLINSDYNEDVFLMASEKLRANASFAITAIAGNYKLFKYISSDLSFDNIFIRELMKTCDPHFMKYVTSIDLITLDMALVNPKFKICCCNKILLQDKKIGLYMITKRPELAKKLPLFYCNENILELTKDINCLPRMLKERVESIQDILDM